MNCPSAPRARTLFLQRCCQGEQWIYAFDRLPSRTLHAGRGAMRSLLAGHPWGVLAVRTVDNLDLLETVTPGWLTELCIPMLSEILCCKRAAENNLHSTKPYFGTS